MSLLRAGLAVGDKLTHIISGEKFEVVALNTRVVFPIILKSESGAISGSTEYGFRTLTDVNPTYTFAPYDIDAAAIARACQLYKANVQSIYSEEVVL